MARPRYDDNFRASAVVMLEAAGWPGREGALSEVARHLGVHRWTLRRWAAENQNPPPREVVTEKKAELSDLLRKEIDAALGAMDGARGDASYRDLGTVTGILVDKLQLLTGEPTENNRTRILIEYADTQIDAATPAQGPADGHRPGEAI